MAKIGWIGLGQMGTPMVENLLKASVVVTVDLKLSSEEIENYHYH